MRKIGVMVFSRVGMQEGMVGDGCWMGRVVLVLVLLSGSLEGGGAGSGERVILLVRERFVRVRRVE